VAVDFEDGWRQLRQYSPSDAPGKGSPGCAARCSARTCWTTCS